MAAYRAVFTGKSCRQLVAEHADADDRERQAVKEAIERRAAKDQHSAASWSGSTTRRGTIMTETAPEPTEGQEPAEDQPEQKDVNIEGPTATSGAETPPPSA